MQFSQSHHSLENINIYNCLTLALTVSKYFKNIFFYLQESSSRTRTKTLAVRWQMSKSTNIFYFRQGLANANDLADKHTQTDIHRNGQAHGYSRNLSDLSKTY